MILGFLQDSDLQPLRDKITDLEFELKMQKETNSRLSEQISIMNSRIQTLNDFCYNMGGDIALLYKKESEIVTE